MCVVWAWYIENDMQFFVVSMIFLFIYIHINKKISFALQLLTLLMSILFIFIMFTIKKYHINGSYEDLMVSQMSDFYLKVYVKPYARISPYMLGLIIGIMYYKHKELKE